MHRDPTERHTLTRPASQVPARGLARPSCLLLSQPLAVADVPAAKLSAPTSKPDETLLQARLRSMRQPSGSRVAYPKPHLLWSRYRKDAREAPVRVVADPT